MFNGSCRRILTPPLLLALLAAAAFVIGCRPGEPQPGPPEPLTVAYSTNLQSALVQIALVKNWFAAEGLDVKPQPYAFGKPALEALLDGKADVATVADTPVMFAVMDGRSLAVLATIQTSNRDLAVVARRDRGIHAPSDLRGKRIGVPRGTNGDFFVDVFLTGHGIDPREVTIVDTPPDRILSALPAGEIDAAVCWHPIVARLQIEMGDRARTFHGEPFYTETFCAVTTRDFARTRTKAIPRFLRALIRAENFVYDRPQEAGRIVADFLKSDPALIEKVWESFDFRVTLDQALVVNLEDQSRWAMKYRLAKRREMPNVLDFIHAEGLQTVKPAAVTLIR